MRISKKEKCISHITHHCRSGLFTSKDSREEDKLSVLDGILFLYIASAMLKNLSDFQCLKERGADWREMLNHSGHKPVNAMNLAGGLKIKFLLSSGKNYVAARGPI